MHSFFCLFCNKCMLERELVQGDSQQRRTGKASMVCCLVSMPMSTICGISCGGLGLVLKFMPSFRVSCKVKETKGNSGTCTEWAIIRLFENMFSFGKSYREI